LQILGGGAVAGDEHLGVTEETVVDDGEHGEEGDAGGTEEEDLREVEQGAGEFFRTVRAAPGEGEEDEDDAAAEEEGELHETEEQEGPLMTAKGGEWGAGEEEAEKDGGEGEAPEADGGTSDGALCPEQPAGIREGEGGGDVRGEDGEGDGVGAAGGGEVTGSFPGELEGLIAGADLNDELAVVQADGEFLVLEFEGGDFGVGGKSEAEVVAEGGLDGEVESGGALAVAELGVVPGAMDGGGGTLDGFGAGDGQVDGFAGPRVPDRGEGGLSGFVGGSQSFGFDVPDGGGAEGPGFDCVFGGFGFEFKGGRGGEFAGVGELFLLSAEAEQEAAFFGAEAGGEESLSREEWEIQRHGTAERRESTDGGVDLPDEAELELSFDDHDGIEVAPVVSGFGGGGAVLFDEEDLIFGDAGRLDACYGPARGVDGDLAGF
jgi:hypothetical protein